MNKTFKRVTALTIVVTILYSVVLAILQVNGNLPVEKTLIVMSKSLSFPLPFEVSLWWGLLVAPMVLLVAAYCTSQNEIYGKEPDSNKNQNVKDKYHVKNSIFCVTAVSLVMGVGTATLATLAAVFTLDSMGGPLSLLVDAIACFSLFYVAFGITGEFMTVVFSEPLHVGTERREFFEEYLSVTANFIKQGFVASLPFLIGHSLAFLVRGIGRVLKNAPGVIMSLRLTTKKEEVSA